MSKTVKDEDRAFLRYVLVGRYNEKRKTPQWEKVLLIFYVEDPPRVVCNAKRVLDFLKLSRTGMLDYRKDEKQKIFHCVEIFDDVLVCTGGWLEEGLTRRGLAFHKNLVEKMKSDRKIKKRKLLDFVKELYEEEDLVDKCKEKIENVKLVMMDTIDKQMERMEKSEELLQESDELQIETEKVKKRTRRLRTASAVTAGITGAIGIGLSGGVVGGLSGLVIGAPVGLSIGLGITGACGGFDGGTATVATVVVVSSGSVLLGGAIGGVAGIILGVSGGAISGGLTALSGPTLSDGITTTKQKLWGLVHNDIESEDEEEEDFEDEF